MAKCPGCDDKLPTIVVRKHQWHRLGADMMEECLSGRHGENIKPKIKLIPTHLLSFDDRDARRRRLQWGLPYHLQQRFRKIREMPLMATTADDAVYLEYDAASVASRLFDRCSFRGIDARQLTREITTLHDSVTDANLRSHLVFARVMAKDYEWDYQNWQHILSALYCAKRIAGRITA